MAEEEETREVLFPDWEGPDKTGLTIEQTSGGEIFVKEVKGESPAARSGKVYEGDQIVGATVYFDNMSSEETAELLKTLNRHKVGLKLQNKGEKSPCCSPLSTPCRSPMGTLTWEGKTRFGGSSPDIILSGDDEDYKRIYTKKIKPRLKSEDLAEGVDVRTERHSSTSSDGSTITTITRRITTYTVDMPGGISEQLEFSSPELKELRHESGDGSPHIRISHGSPSGKVGAEKGVYESSNISYTGPQLSTTETHWSSGGIQTTTITREGERFKGPKFEVKGKEVFEMSSDEQQDGNIQVSGTSMVSSDSTITSGRHITIGGLGGVELTSADENGGSISTPLTGKNMQTSTLSMHDVDTSLGARTKVTVFESAISHPHTKGSGSIDIANVRLEADSRHIDTESKGGRIGDSTITLGNVTAGYSSVPGKIDITLPQVDTKGTNGAVEIKKPSLDSKVKGPNVDLFGAKTSEITDLGIKIESTTTDGHEYGSKTNIIGNKDVETEAIKMLKVNVSPFGKGQKVKVDVKGPEVDSKGLDIGMERNRNIKSSEIKVPSFSEAQMSTPNVDVSVKGSKLRFNEDISHTKTEGSTSTFDVDVKCPEVEITEPKGGFKKPEMEIPKFDFKGTRAESPDSNIQLPKVNIGLNALGIDKKTPGIEIKHVDAEIKGPKVKVLPNSGQTITNPNVNLNLTGPKIKIPKGPEMQDLDIPLKSPEIEGDLDVSVRKIEREIKPTNVDIKGTELDIERKTGGFEIPQLKIPTSGVKGQTVAGHDIDVNLPKADIDVKAPDVTAQAMDIEVHDAKIKGSKFTIPNVKGPEIPDLDVKLKSPKLTGDVAVSLPKVEGDIKGREMDVEGLRVGTDGEKGGIKMPKFKLPSFGIAARKLDSSDVDLNVQKPDVDIQGPEVDIKGAEVEIESQPSGFEMPKIKMPTFGFKSPNVAGADVDVKLPKVNIDVKSPDVDVTPPEIDIEGPDATIKGSKFKIPNIKGPKVSDLDVKLKSPKLPGGVSVSLPTAEGDIKGPEVDVDIDGEKGGIKMPTFKLPSFGISGPKSPSLDVDLKVQKPDIDIQAPEGTIKGPHFDIHGPSGEIKMPSLSRPKISMPDVDFNLKGAKLKGDVDVSVPKIEGHIKGPDVDIKGPELEMESRKGGFELPKFKMPKFGFKGPKVECPDVDVNLPKADIDVKAPDVDFTAPAIDIEGPGATIKGPKFKIPDITGPKMPEWDLKLKSPKLPGGVSVSLPAAEGDIKGPEVDVDIDGEKGGIKMPTFKLPSFGISGPKSPSLDVDLKVQKPDIDIQAPEGTIKGPHFDIHGPSGEIKMPSISMPKISIPDVNLDLQGPKLKGDLDFTVPKIEGEITSPNLDTKGPEFEIERKNHGYEMPKINMPKFGLKAPTVAGAEIDVNLPKADFDLKADDVDITPPAIDIEVPDRKVKGAKFKIPNVKGPEFDPHVSLTKIEGEAKAPDVDMHLKGSKLKLAIDLQKTEYTGPDINIDATDIGTKKPKFKIPKFGFKGSKIKTPDADLKIAGDIGVSPQIGSEDLEIDMGLTGPKTKGAKFKIPKLGFKSPKIELPAVDVNLPKVDFESKTPDIDLPNVKIEGAKLEMPNTSGPKLSLPDMDFNLEGPKAEGDMDVSLPEIEGVIEAPDIDVDGHKGGFKMPKIKMPTLGLKGTGFDGSNIEINLPKAEVDVKGLELNIEGKPGNIQGPKFSMPSISGSKPPMPDVDLSLQGPKLKGEVDMPGMEIKGGLSVDTKGQDIKGPKGEFNMPKIKMPSMNIIGSNVEGVDVALSSPKANINIEKPDFEEPEANIKGPNFNMMQISGHKISMPNMDFNSKGPTLKGDVDAFVPKIDGDITNANVNIKGPEVRIDPAKTSVTFPKFKGPRLGMKSPEIGGTDPTVNTPIVNVGAKGSRTKHSLPDTEASLDVPDIDISGKGKTGKFRLPKVKAKAKKTDFEIETPAKNLDVDTPNVPIKGTKVKKPLFGIHFPNVEFDIKSPKIKVDDLPSANLDTTNDSPNVSFEGPDVKLKTPKMPNVNISATDFDTNLITYEEANVAAGFNVEGDAKIDTGVPEGSASGGLHYPQGIVTFPKMKVPRFGIALPQLETQRGGGNVKLEFASEGAHLQGPSISGQVISQTVEVPSPELRDTGGKVKVKRPKMFGKSKAKGSSAGDLQGPEIGLSASGKDVKVSKDLELEGHSGLSVSTKGKSASLDLFKKSRQRSSSSMSDEGGLAISSPSGHLETEGGDISVDLGKSKVKGKKGKLKFGTFGGFGSKSKGSYEVTLGDNSDAGMEGNVGGSLPSKKSRLSSSSSSDSGSRGFRFPRLELSVSPKND